MIYKFWKKMKKAFFWAFAALFLVSMALVSCSKDDDKPLAANETDHNETDYTVIIYGTSGGSMDYTVEEVWRELRNHLTDQRVRVICAYKYGKGGEEFTGTYANAGDMLYFELTKDTRFEDLRNYVIADSSYRLFSADNLTAVLNRAAQDAPAKKYVLVTYGHGNGFDPYSDYPRDSQQAKGVISDEWYDREINMYELSQAIRQSNVQHLECLMLHNCLMGGMESLMEVVPCAEYIMATPFMLTSEDNPLIPILVKNLRTKSDFESAARATLDESAERLRYGYSQEGEPLQNGCMELLKASALNDVCTTTGRLVDRLCGIYSSQHEAIDSATCRVYRFFNMNPYFDLLDYAAKLAEATQDAELQAIHTQLAADFGRAILKQVTVDLGACPALPAYSLSVLLVNKEAYEDDFAVGTFTYRQAYEYSTFHQRTHWGNWLATNLQTPTGNPCGQVIKLFF